MAESLQIHTIYRSIQGESTQAGRPCTFVRTTGCPLRCRWCDTPDAFTGGKRLSLSEIMERVQELGVPLVEITGGEPLAQEATSELCRLLLQAGYEVMMETGGSEDIGCVPKGVRIIMDLKCPGSGMEDHNRYENLLVLKSSDEVKFVIASQEDYVWSCDVVRRYDLLSRFHVLFSPAFGVMKPALLVQWMLDDGVQARLNLQLHKWIWHPRAKDV